jgi:hypothetical protein
VQLALVALAVIVLAVARARALEDLLNAILVAASALVAGMVAVFVIQVRHARKRAAPARPVSVVAAPRPAQATAAQQQKAVQATPMARAATLVSEREAPAGHPIRERPREVPG